MKRLEQQAKGSVPAGTLAFVTKISVFGFGLRVFWIVTNVILLPNRVEETVRASLHGTALGLIAFLGVGLAVIVQPMAGRASDVWPGVGKRRPFIITGTLLMLPGLALFGGAMNAGMVLAGFVLAQLGGNIGQAAFQAFIPDLVQKDHRGLASGAKNILAVLGSAIGLLGGEAILLGHGAIGWVMIYIAVVLVATAILTLRWVPRVPGEEHGSWRSTILPAINPHDVWTEAVEILRRHHIFRCGVLAQFLFMLGTYPSERFLVLFLKARFGGSVHEIVAVGGVAVIAIAILAAGVAGVLSDLVGRPRVLMVAALCGGAGMLLVGLAVTIPLLMVAGGLIAVGYGAFLAVNWALLNDDLPKGEAAAALGVANIASAGAAAIAGLFGPVLDIMNAVEPRVAYQVLFGLAAVVTVLALVPLRRLQEDAC